MSAPPPPLGIASSFFLSFALWCSRVDRVSLSRLVRNPVSLADRPSSAHQRELIICHDEGYFELYQFRHHHQSYGMNAVPGTLFSIISNVILRGGKQNYWHPFVHLFVRASFALGEFRAVTLFVLCPPPLILCPPTPFGAMMPSTHSSSGVIDPLPLPNNAERTTDAIIPPRGGGP